MIGSPESKFKEVKKTRDLQMFLEDEGYDFSKKTIRTTSIPKIRKFIVAFRS